MSKVNKTNYVSEASEFAHHGELIQGVFEGPDSKLYRGLITLKFSAFSSTAIFIKEKGMKDIIVFPKNKIKALKAAKLSLKHLGKEKEFGGYLIMRSDIPEGFGFGSSTSDVVTTIKAVSSSFNKNFSQEEIAEIAVSAETASDAIMFKECVLFAQRDGKVLKIYNVSLPPFYIIGFNDSKGETIDTLTFEPAKYNLDEIHTFKILERLFEHAIKNQDQALIGQIATVSSKINQKYLPKPHFKEILEIAKKVKALGVQVAHSGTVVGLIFSNDINKHEKYIEVQQYLKEIGIYKTWEFKF